MAKDVLALLKSSNAWIDPNLVELVGTDGHAKKKQRRHRDDNPNAHAKGKASGNAMEANQEEVADEDGDDWDDGQFANLSANRIVLQRAGHVSDASESDSDEVQTA